MAGTLAYAIAEGAGTAALVIHEFKTREAEDPLHQENARDLTGFLLRLGNVRSDTAPFANTCELLGPFTVQGSPPFEKPPPLLIGRIVTDRRSVG